jgi:hypothetical protein
VSVAHEKATLMSLAILAISSGITLIERGNLLPGIVLVIIGIGLILLREHFKFHRWAHVNTYWRGKSNHEWQAFLAQKEEVEHGGG